MEKDKDKDKGNGKDKADAPKPVADYWINPSLKEHKPTARGIVIRTGGKPVAEKDDQPK